MITIRRFAATAIVTVLAATVTACGAGPDKADYQVTDADRTFVEEASAALDAASSTPEDLPVDTPLEGDVSGKDLLYLEPAIPTAKLIGDRINEATEALGMEVRRLNIGVTPDTVSAGLTEAVRLKPDAIVIVAFGPEFYAKQAKQLADMDIPVIGIGFNGCDTLRIECMTGEVPIAVNVFGRPDALVAGKLMADKVVVDSEGLASVAYFGAPDLSFDAPIRKGFVDELEKCNGCDLDAVDVTVQSIGTELPAQIVSYLQAHPDVKYVGLQYGDFAIGVPQALKAAGLTDVKLVTQSSSAAQFKDIEAGGSQIVDIPAAYGYLAYLSVDAAARVLSGQEIDPAQVHQPPRVMVKGSLDDSDDGYYPGVAGYQDQFLALWGAKN
jgi:ribose transport system substrate-binding protein